VIGILLLLSSSKMSNKNDNDSFTVVEYKLFVIFTTYFSDDMLVVVCIRTYTVISPRFKLISSFILYC
jgi:hypothetical protein